MNIPHTELLCVRRCGYGASVSNAIKQAKDQATPDECRRCGADVETISRKSVTPVIRETFDAAEAVALSYDYEIVPADLLRATEALTAAFLDEYGTSPPPNRKLAESGDYALVHADKEQVLYVVREEFTPDLADDFKDRLFGALLSLHSRAADANDVSARGGPGFVYRLDYADHLDDEDTAEETDDTRGAAEPEVIG